MNFIFVGLGGAVGAVLRYCISLLPVKTAFPVLTFITNIIGALAIGLVAALAAKHHLPDNLVLMLKTGVCGGFTTFSTFSLEAYNLVNGGNVTLGILYAVLSLICCVAAVFLGMAVAGR